MIDAKTKKERLGQARKLFESALDQNEDWFRECQEDLDFRHSRQWEPEDEQYLRRQNRPILTFNLIHAKIHHILGTLLDNVKESVIVPVGLEDQLQAEVLEFIRRSIYQESEMEMVDLRVFDDGVTTGIGNVAIDVAPDPKDESRLRFDITPIHPLELIWDPACDQMDKSDAAYLIWTRWLPVAQFKTEYPEFADQTDKLMNQASGDIGLGYEEQGQSSGLHEAPRFWDYRPRRELLYYDRRREQIRVIHMEYILAKKETVAISRDGTRKVIPSSMRSTFEEQFPGEMAFETRWAEKTMWLEFIGNDILFDDESPMPFDGFSVVPFVSHADDQNKPYGKVRLLKDPQREFNKRYSQTLHLINSQVAPGIFAETNAIADEAAAEESMKIPGSVTYLEPGALSGKASKICLPQYSTV